ncbi:MAG: hypothetical protein A2921_00840 [Candidatus Magasanikbacteria bacterium RIFCSPLOWO2_01_FULL_43_20b]|uniref:Four helix bundle protein n=1 Tax=Candidatus Magasanikbacteria bacterium RIFCSPLOWO2_12_FULL_43_12 TaxID=1798692 RepID=A0A1F6MVI4_9BACT|nr:MAG: hypothetical protein A3I93_00560 [Candidatus Magasanikbacteria bacterium RIFCSPLOWO2_02_FULL_43_22]OGH72825.1 MAG: hypothetical protein A2921_00840 [Candidatus Magasanikbacteria bacterium RIFCSPLOWO2_01_FULL_43_20b]OGH75621.1 MAG: hypothetical protein A3G00_03955 [Candidatus Magasanikbacteria bacterium RIFCSPLOWO2_12_FULL_43_12]
MQYDLEGRTKKFSKDVMALLATIKIKDLNRNIIIQLGRSVTSVAANYCEANAASSRKDFANKIFICRKEIQETKYWLEMLATTNTELKATLRPLWSEAHQLTLIFNKISSSLRKNGGIKN